MTPAEHALRVSVAMCTCDGERFLADQLASLAAQTRLPDEVVICDDASTDGTWTLLSAFARHAPFPVTLHRNDMRLGVIGNFSQAIARATGDLIALADQDDLWEPTKIDVLEASLIAHPQAGFVFSDADLIDDRGERIGATLWQVLGITETRQQQLTGDRAFDLLVDGCTVTGAAMMFRATFREVILPIPEDLWFLHDGWAALMMATLAPVALVREPLLQYRQHAAQQVGVTRVPTEIDTSLAGGLARRNSYELVIRVLVRVLDRLAPLTDLPGRDRAVRDVQARLTHLRARAALPARSAKRIALVMRELASGRYHRYGRGVLSAAKDAVS